MNRSYTNPFEMQDVTSDLIRIPTNLYTITGTGLFRDEFVSTPTVQFEEQIVNGKLIVDTVRGSRGQVAQNRSRKIHTFPVPHFSLETAVYPRDIAGKRAYGNANVEETEAAVMMRKMEDIARDWDYTKEVAMARLITTGDIYSPSGLVSHNWRSEFGLGAIATIDYELDVATTKVLRKNEDVINQVYAGLQNGGRVTGVMALCSTEWFSAFVNHPSVEAAYANWTNNQDVIRSRVGTPVSSLNRTFNWGGIMYQEVKDSYDGQRLIPAGEAYFVPTGTDIFRMYHSPAERFDTVNSMAERMYMWQYRSPRNDKIEIITESNFAPACMAPDAIVKATI